MTQPLPQGLQAFFGCQHAVAVGSGTVGLAVLLRALGAEGKHVLIPALACPNVAVSVLAAGATPKLVDVSADKYDFDLEALAAAVDGGVAAVVAIDAFGMPSDVDAIEKACGCAVIEDACQAYGGIVDGAALGARGRAGVVSFGYAKPFELGGGGAVLTNDGDLARRIEETVEGGAYRRFTRLKNRGALKLMMKDDYNGMLARDRRMGLLKYRFPAPQLRRLTAGFDRWVEDVARVRANVDRIRGTLNPLPGVVPFVTEGHGTLLPWRYSVKVPERSVRDALVERMAGHGVRTTRLYRPVTDFLDVECAGDIATAREVSEQTINIAYRSTAEDTRRVAECLEQMASEMG